MNDQREIPELIVHSPIRPVRKGHPAEAVYLEKWIELMGTMPSGWTEDSYEDVPIALAHLESIICDNALVADQRSAHVAASFIVWLGTACGRAFIDRMERMQKAAGRNAGLFAWTQENRRVPHVNHGLRCIELLLAPADHFIHTNSMTRCPLSQIPDLSIRDHEIIDALANWLGNAGRGFVVSCESEISRRAAWERQKHFARLRTPQGMTAPS